jgi:hypothetical protein
MIFLLAVFGQKVYWFKLLSELSLNSGYDYLRRVWFIIGRNSPRHYADRPTSHGYHSQSLHPLPETTPSKDGPPIPTVAIKECPPLFMIEGGRS